MSCSPTRGTAGPFEGTWGPGPDDRPKRYAWKSAKWIKEIHFMKMTGSASGKCAAIPTPPTPGRKTATRNSQRERKQVTGIMAQQSKNAAIIIIGNEILSGKVQDANSPYLTGELRALGVDVQRISVIPDEIDTIGEEVAACRKRYHLVFTSGGVGPTHDDVTMEGIARGRKAADPSSHPRSAPPDRLRGI